MPPIDAGPLVFLANTHIPSTALGPRFADRLGLLLAPLLRLGAHRHGDQAHHLLRVLLAADGYPLIDHLLLAACLQELRQASFEATPVGDLPIRTSMGEPIAP